MGDLLQLPERVGELGNLRAALRWTRQTSALVRGDTGDAHWLAPERAAQRKRSLSELEDYEMDLDEQLTAALNGET